MSLSLCVSVTLYVCLYVQIASTTISAVQSKASVCRRTLSVMVMMTVGMVLMSETAVSTRQMSELFGVSGKWAPSHWLWPSQSYPYFLLWSGIKPMNTYKACITSGNRIFFRSVDWRHTPYRTSVQLSKPSDATYCARPMGQPSRGRRLPELGQLTIEMSYLVISTTLPLCQWMFFYYFILFSNVICHCGIYYIIYILHIYVDFSVSSGQPW